MSRYRKVDLRIWGDERVRRLSLPKPNGRDCWLYLLTAKESTMLPGAIPAGIGAISESLRWPPRGFRAAFSQVEAEGLAVADWSAGLVWVPKAMRYNPPENPNVAKAWGKAFAELPDCELKLRAGREVESYLSERGEAFLKAFREGFGKSGAVPGAGARAGEPDRAPSPAVDLQLEEVEHAAPSIGTQALQVYEHWRKVMAKGPATKFVDERRKAVEARLRGGRTVEDLKLAIDGCARTPHNMGANDTKARFDDLELICRNELQVERFMANASILPPLTAKSPQEAACQPF